MEQKLKQRLAGAIVLVALAVIFVPIILEGPDEEWTPQKAGIPEPPRIDYGVDMELPLPPAESEPLETADLAESQPPAPMQEIDRTPAGAQTQQAAVPEPVAAPPPQAEPKKPAPPPPPAPTPAAETAASAAGSTTLPVPPPGWYIQVGSFSQQLNAEGLRDRLQAAGHTTQIQAINIGKAQVYRVLVGPAKARASAEQLNSRLQKQQQLKGIVIEYPG